MKKKISKSLIVTVALIALVFIGGIAYFGFKFFPLSIGGISYLNESKYTATCSELADKWTCHIATVGIQPPDAILDNGFEIQLPQEAVGKSCSYSATIQVDSFNSNWVSNPNPTGACRVGNDYQKVIIAFGSSSSSEMGQWFGNNIPFGFTADFTIQKPTNNSIVCCSIAKTTMTTIPPITYKFSTVAVCNQNSGSIVNDDKCNAIVYALDPDTKECITFNSSSNVPASFIVVDKCPSFFDRILMFFKGLIDEFVGWFK